MDFRKFLVRTKNPFTSYAVFVEHNFWILNLRAYRLVSYYHSTDFYLKSRFVERLLICEIILGDRFTLLFQNFEINLFKLHKGYQWNEEIVSWKDRIGIRVEEWFLPSDMLGLFFLYRREKQTRRGTWWSNQRHPRLWKSLMPCLPFKGTRDRRGIKERKEEDWERYLGPAFRLPYETAIWYCYFISVFWDSVVHYPIIWMKKLGLFFILVGISFEQLYNMFLVFI